MTRKAFHYQRTSKRPRNDGVYIPFKGHTIFVPEEHILLRAIAAEALIGSEITQEDKEVRQIAKLLQMSLNV